MSEARALTKALGGNWFRSYGTAPCPVCQPERRKDQMALTLSDGRNGLLANCKKSNCTFVNILKAAGVLPKKRGIAPVSRPTADQTRQRDLKSRYARHLWNESTSLAGTPAETYLRNGRSITAPLPDTLRFCPNAWHGPSCLNLPAMIARIDGVPGFAVTRTYLQPGSLDKARLPKEQQKMMLGQCAGGHVLLRPGSGALVVAEGIETGLSLACGLVDINAAIWATLTATNMQSVRLPASPGHLIIATDGDEAGRTAGNKLACRALDQGWIVEIKPAPDGKDWNDVLVLGQQCRYRAQETSRYGL